jgi:hypothetical protein
MAPLDEGGVGPTGNASQLPDDASTFLVVNRKLAWQLSFEPDAIATVGLAAYL